MRRAGQGLIVALALATLGAVVISCGNSGNVHPITTGGLITFITDAPYRDVLSFRVNITEMDFPLPTNISRLPVVVFPPRNAFYQIKTNFVGLRDRETILNVATVQTRTFDKAVIKFSLPQITVYDATKDPPITTFSPRFSTLAPTVPISPPLVIEKGKVSGLRLDFDMRNSLELDSQGQVTTDVNPTLTLTPVSAPDDTTGFGELEDLAGFISSVGTSGATKQFIGSLSVYLFSGSGPLIPANLTGSTNPPATTICAPATVSDAACTSVPLNEITTASVVEMDGHIDTKGNFIARNVEIENQADITKNKIALVGNVLSVVTDASGNLTSFNLFVREEIPDMSFTLPLDQVVTVNPSSTTIYQYSSRWANYVSPVLDFQATSIAPGQEVIVHGTFTKPTPTTPPPPTPQLTTVAADSVYLNLQSHMGNFTSLVQAAPDDRTGAFWLGDCGSIFQGAPILVITTGPISEADGTPFETTFIGLNGLSGLSPQPLVVVQGLLFFEPQATTINGVAVPAGTLVLLARKVHQLI